MDERTKRAMRHEAINPHIAKSWIAKEDIRDRAPGKTLLDEFAGRIVADGKTNWHRDLNHIAKDSYRISAAMLMHRAEILGIEVPE